MRYYCTYFDANYLTRGLVLHRSLLAHAGPFELVVLCLDEKVEAILRQNALPNVRLLSVQELAKRYPPLTAARANRTTLEFYFTCTPWLVRHLLEQVPAGELLTYLDADLCFFNSPAPIYEEIGTASVAIIPHRFPPSLGHLERYGRFNVGWVSFRHDAVGQACAADWADKCAVWCFNRYELDRYADQKYLDQWEADFKQVACVGHPGANVAPWNIKDRELIADRAGLQIDGQPLIFYHFHALKHIGQNLYESGLHRYNATVTLPLRSLVYQPYLQQLLAVDPAQQNVPAADLIPPVDPHDSRHLFAAGYLLDLLAISELDRAKRLIAIEEVEVNSAARLKVIEQMQRQLEEHGKARQAAEARLAELDPALKSTREYLANVEANSAARLKAIEQMQRQLEEHGRLRHAAEARATEFEQALQGTRVYLATIEADRAARLAGIHSLTASLRELQSGHDRTVEYLHAVEADSAARLALIKDLQNKLDSLAAANKTPKAG